MLGGGLELLTLKWSFQNSIKNSWESQRGFERVPKSSQKSTRKEAERVLNNGWMDWNWSYVELFLPHFTERSQNERLAEQIGATEAAANMMKDRHDAVVDEWAVCGEILERRSITINDCLVTKLGQVFLDVESNLQKKKSNSETFNILNNNRVLTSWLMKSQIVWSYIRWNYSLKSTKTNNSE